MYEKETCSPQELIYLTTCETVISNQQLACEYNTGVSGMGSGADANMDHNHSLTCAVVKYLIHKQFWW